MQQVEHIRLTPRVESARLQLVESAPLSSHWFQQLLNVGPYNVKLRQRVADGVRDDPTFSKKDKYFLERDDLYRTVRKEWRHDETRERERERRSGASV